MVATTARHNFIYNQPNRRKPEEQQEKKTTIAVVATMADQCLVHKRQCLI